MCSTARRTSVFPYSTRPRVPACSARGQDIVIAPFRAFRERHPEALLASCWGTSCLDGMEDLDNSQHIDGLPEVRDGALQLTAWLARNGVPPPAVLDIGRLPDSQLPGSRRECDLTVFPSVEGLLGDVDADDDWFRNVPLLPSLQMRSWVKQLLGLPRNGHDGAPSAQTRACWPRGETGPAAGHKLHSV